MGGSVEDLLAQKLEETNEEIGTSSNPTETEQPQEVKEITEEIPTEQATEVKEEEPSIVEEPEFDLGDGEKVKLSQIKEWKDGGLRQSDYTKKTQELSEKRKGLEEMEKFADYLKANPKKLQKVIGILEEKEEAAEKKADLYEGMDADDPYVKLMKQQNEVLMKELTGVKTSLENKQKEEQTKQAQQVLTGTLDTTAKTFEFADDIEKKAWRQLVLSHLKDNPKAYQSEDDFKQSIADVGKTYYDNFKKIGEAKIKAYLKSKEVKVPTTPAAPSGNVAPHKVTEATLQDDIFSMMEELEKKGNK